jgi:hypothetical protein
VDADTGDGAGGCSAIRRSARCVSQSSIAFCTGSIGLLSVEAELDASEVSLDDSVGFGTKDI